VQGSYGLVVEVLKAPLASDKLVVSDHRSEESQPAKTFTEEHKVHARPMNFGGYAQQYEAYNNEIHR
jgi:hypothetical protein